MTCGVSIPLHSREEYGLEHALAEQLSSTALKH